MALGSEIRDPENTYSGSRIPGSKRHRIPDLDPQHWIFLWIFGCFESVYSMFDFDLYKYSLH
jgi:hypothetical protein